MAFRKHRPEVGARPGTLAIPAGSEPPRLRVVRYSEEKIEEKEIEDPREVRRFLGQGTVCWLDVRGLGDEEVLRAIGEEFDIHPLALEDAVNVPQRAKSEAYEDHQLVISRVSLQSEGGELTVPQVCFMIGSNYLITFQEQPLGLFEPVRERLRAGKGPIRRSGPDYLAYALIDTMVDHYYPIAEALSSELDALEDSISEEPEVNIMPAIHAIRRKLVILRRIGWPQREMINALIRDRTDFVSDEVRTYLRDTNDHISQIMELVDSAREMDAALADIYLSNLNQRTNEVMKILTIMASIFIPLTFIAGIYGMNFEHMPELHYRLGYFGVLIVMVIVAGGMIVYFLKKGWIGGGKSK